MNLIERLRNAEPQGREAAWQGLSRAPMSLEEAQSRLRRNMRIYPRTAKPAAMGETRSWHSLPGKVGTLLKSK